MSLESEEKDQTEKKLITMRDVANAAGVSISTVSRILDERLPPSKSASAEKVRQVARELGYKSGLCCLQSPSRRHRDTWCISSTPD